MLEDEYLSLAGACRIMPGHPSIPSCWRWCRIGYKVKDGGRIRLRYAKPGRKIFTKKTWVEAFMSAVAEADNRYYDENLQPVQHSTRTERQEARAIDEARNFLRSKGVLE